jgi:hypothetical protein
VPREVSDHAETSRHLGADVAAVLDGGFDAAGCVQAGGHVSTWPPGSATATTTPLGMLLIGGGPRQPHHSKQSPKGGYFLLSPFQESSSRQACALPELVEEGAAWTGQRGSGLLQP